MCSRSDTVRSEYQLPAAGQAKNRNDRCKPRLAGKVLAKPLASQDGA